MGAIKNWLTLQGKNQCIFAVVDYHGITTPFDPKTIKQEVRDVVLDYLAVGLDPKKSLIIIQSQLPEHTELAWILGTITPVSWLERIPSYKEKRVLHPKYVNLGLLAYPVLMASDILLYRATKVPVGEDQLPHIELTNEIARRFNNMFGKTFDEVKAVLGTGSKIMSLTNPAQKMSKTGDEGIALSDSPDIIREKIKKAVTDSGKDIKYDPKNKPAISNLLTIYNLFSGKSVNPVRDKIPKASAQPPREKISNGVKEIEKEWRNKGYAEFKKDLAEVVIEGLKSFREKRTHLEKDKDYTDKVLEESHQKAQKMANETLNEVKTKIGLV